MIPLRDDIPTHGVPWVNYTLLIACIVVFLLEAVAPDGGERIIEQYGMIPARVLGKSNGGEARPVFPSPFEQVAPPGTRHPTPLPPWATLFTCMFLHGGLMHLVGNMLFLYIFGDNVEDRYGHLGYAAMYLGSGLAAGGLHIATGPNSTIPTVGASGAIAGVMGAYFVMFRHSRVMTLIPLGVFTQIVAIPAPAFLGVWFVMQLVSAGGAQAEAAGVAFWAHVGGFVTGFGLTAILRNSGRLQGRDRFSDHVPAWQRRQLPWN